MELRDKDMSLQLFGKYVNSIAIRGEGGYLKNPVLCKNKVIFELYSSLKEFSMRPCSEIQLVASSMLEREIERQK